MEIIKLKLSEIIPYDNNPRRNEGAVDAVVESIKQCGYCSPILVDENNIILAGHTRFKALKKLGWKGAEVVVRSGLTDEQKRKYRLLDNKTNEFATWDIDKLDAELEGLDFGGFDFYFNTGLNGRNEFTPVTNPQYEGNYPDVDDEGFDKYQSPMTNDELESYEENAEGFLAKRRVIITFAPEQEEDIRRLLGIVDENMRIVYDLNELLGGE